MPAYVISEVLRYRDQAAAARYRPLARESVLAHGGRYLLLTGDVLAPEGEWDAQRRIVVMEFDDLDAARGWYDSPEYAPARAIAPDAFERRLLIVPGIE